MASRLEQQVPVTWQAGDMLAVVAFMAGSFVAPVVAPMVGAFLVRSSPRWSERGKQVATVLGMLPAVLGVLVVLAGVLGAAREPSHLLLGMVVVVVASHVSGVVAGALLLFGFRGRHAADPRGGRRGAGGTARAVRGARARRRHE
jgi:hypothetical protein